MRGNKKTTKFILYFLIILVIIPTVIFSAPQKTYADPACSEIVAAVDVELAEVKADALTVAVSAENGCSFDAGCAQSARNIYDAAVSTATIGASDEKKSILATCKDPPASGWIARTAAWINNVNTHLIAVYDGQDLGIDLARVGKEVLRQALIALGHQLLSQMTQSTVNWINSGFHGSPLFVQNPDQFFSNIAESEVKNIINEVGYDPRQPFGQQYALNLINQYKASSARDEQYSLSQVTNNPTLLNSYMNNFSSGGWNAFLLNTQYPQNNYIGYTMMMNQNLAAQLAGSPVQNTIQKATTLLSQGNGFLSPTMCPASINPNYNTVTNEFNPPVFNASAANEKDYSNIPDCIPACSNQAAIDNEQKNGLIVEQCIQEFGVCSNQAAIDAANAAGDTAYAADQAAFNKTSACINPATGKSALVATTPGAVVGNQIMTALNLKTGVAGLDAALGNSMSAILNTLMNHFLSEGLSGLSTAVQSEPPLDNWSYNGQSLDGTNTLGALNIPTNVSLNAGDTTSTAISGGTAPYSVETQSAASLQIATATISGSTLSVTGISQGTTSITVQDSTSANQVTTPVPIAQVSTITIGGAIGTAGTLSATINSVVTSVLVTSNDTPITATTSLANAINANSKINATVIAANNTPGTITITSKVAGTAGVFSLTSANTTTLLTATSAITTPASDGQTNQNQTAIVTITVGTNGNILLNFNNLASNPKNISASVGNSMNLTLSGGTQPYNVQTEPDSTIALALINNNTLTVVGVGPGITSLSLQDSNGITINLGVTVGNETPLVASPSSVSTNVSGTSTATISGGTPPYNITTNSSDIASVSVSGNTITTTGSVEGNTSVTIQDSYSPAESITVPINIGATTVTLNNTNGISPQSVTINTGGSTNITMSSVMSNGTAPYSIQTPPNSSVANASISNGVLTITGVGAGATTVVVQDSSTPAQTTTFNITITQPAGVNTTF